MRRQELHKRIRRAKPAASGMIPRSGSFGPASVTRSSGPTAELGVRPARTRRAGQTLRFSGWRELTHHPNTPGSPLHCNRLFGLGARIDNTRFDLRTPPVVISRDESSHVVTNGGRHQRPNSSNLAIAIHPLHPRTAVPEVLPTLGFQDPVYHLLVGCAQTCSHSQDADSSR